MTTGQTALIVTVACAIAGALVAWSAEAHKVALFIMVVLLIGFVLGGAALTLDD